MHGVHARRTHANHAYFHRAVLAAVYARSITSVYGIFICI